MFNINNLPTPVSITHDKISYVPKGDWVNIRVVQEYFKKILDGDTGSIELDKSPYITTSHHMEKKDHTYDIGINDGNKPYHVHTGTNLFDIKRALNTLPDMFSIKVTENRHISNIRHWVTNDTIYVSIGGSDIMLLPLTNENNKLVTYELNKTSSTDIYTVLDVLAWFGNGHMLSIRDGYVVIPEGFRGIGTSTGSVAITYTANDMCNHQVTLTADGSPRCFHFTNNRGTPYCVQYNQLDSEQLLFQLGLADIVVTRDMIVNKYLPEPRSNDEALLYQWAESIILRQPTKNIPPLHIITL